APMPLVEKKLVIDRLAVTGMRFGTTRQRSARTSPRAGSTPARLLASVGDSARGVPAPLLALTPIATIRPIVMDPSSPATIKAANALAKSADSIKTDLTRRVDSLQLQALSDSTQALVKELAAFKPSVSNLPAIAQQVDRAKRGLDRVNDAKKKFS